MTALVVLEHDPLAAGRSGPAFVVTRHDVVDTDRRRHNDESVVPVQAGERLTERQALLALLLPSANNSPCCSRGRSAAASTTFVAEMNSAWPIGSA